MIVRDTRGISYYRLGILEDKVGTNHSHITIYMRKEHNWDKIK